MSLKAQDLQTFEAYKKAMRAAAGHVGNDTPFCIFSDVQLPDSSQKMHTLKPFLVVGTPAGMISPLLKDLHGGKKLSCSGLCSLEDGKISLEAKSGTVNYGLFKSQSTIFKDLLGKEILIPSGNQHDDGHDAAKNDAEKSIPAAPFGKITYHASYESKILPLLTEAIKGFQKAGDMDGELKERFQVIDAFSKKIPPLDAVKQEFLKVDGNVKVEAQNLRAVELQVKSIKAQWKLLASAAKEAHKNLLITEDDLKAADDMQRARKIRESLEMAPWLKLLMKTGEAAIAWAKVEEDPMGTIGPTLEMVKSELEVLGLDKANQQIKALEAEAVQLQWKSVVARFKLALQKVDDITKLRAELVPLVQQAQEDFKNRAANVPADFDAANKNGHFHFKSMTDLQDMLHKYRDFAQQAVTTAYHAAESVNKLQRPDVLGTAWMANVTQDKDIVDKMLIVTERATKRAIHERDGADAHIKTLGQQIHELEKILSNTRVKPS